MLKRIFFRYLYFIIIVLILIPLLSFLITNLGRIHPFQSVFQLQTTFIILAAIVGIYILLVRNYNFKLEKINWFFVGISLFNKDFNTAILFTIGCREIVPGFIIRIARYR